MDEQRNLAWYVHYVYSSKGISKSMCMLGTDYKLGSKNRLRVL